MGKYMKGVLAFLLTLAIVLAFVTLSSLEIKFEFTSEINPNRVSQSDVKQTIELKFTISCGTILHIVQNIPRIFKKARLLIDRLSTKLSRSSKKEKHQKNLKS